VVTSDNPRSESPEAIIAAIVSGMSRPPDRVEPDRARAIAVVLDQAAPADVVLIAGKGHEAWQEFADRRVEFSDAREARAALARRAPGACNA
jgi:UDP-N-acetylmuramoyl-L-alanyl-D-glutamate--2,6-diaminopimelate ligase